MKPEYRKRERYNTPEYKKKEAERVKKWREKYQERMCAWRKNNRHIIKELQKNQVKNLCNYYIRSLICKRSDLKHKDIPQQMVDLYRLNLIIKREKWKNVRQYKNSK